MNKKKIFLLCGIVVLTITWAIQLVQKAGSGITELTLKKTATEFVIKQPNAEDITIVLQSTVPANSLQPEGEQVQQWSINAIGIAENTNIA
ncbi:MAG TPA: hypothetical protein VFC68_03615, partial [Treponemataceae bacterium]|nr:hypothetical protein [Treponemataceae bacterium]